MFKINNKYARTTYLLSFWCLLLLALKVFHTFSSVFMGVFKSLIFAFFDTVIVKNSLFVTIFATVKKN